MKLNCLLIVITAILLIGSVKCVCPSITKSDDLLKPAGFWKLQETGDATTTILNSGSQGAAANGKFRSATPDFLEQSGVNHDCVVGKCYEFDQTASEGVEISWIDGFSNAKSFSVAAWVYVTDATDGSYKSIVTNRHHYGATNRQSGFAFYLQAQERPQMWLARYNPTTDAHWWTVIISPVSCEQDRWNHVVATYDFDSKTLALYLNGIQVAKVVQAADEVYTPPPQNAGKDSMYIGTGSDSGNGYPFLGRIDEVRYYLYSLSETQVEKLFDKASVMLASKPEIYLPLEDSPAGGNILNYGYENIGNPTFGTSTINSKSNCENNKCVEITGGNNNIILPLKAGVSDTTIFSLSVWVRPSEIDRVATIYDSFECCADRKGLLLRILANNRISFAAGKGGTSSYATSTTIILVKQNEWTHIALTYSSVVNGGEFNFYVNGVLARRQTSEVYVAPTIANAFIGNRLSGAEAFKGDIDEFAYYTRVLSQAEIQQLVWKAMPSVNLGIKNMVAGSKFKFTVTFNEEVVNLQPSNFEFSNQQDAVVESVTKVNDFTFTVLVSYPKKHAKKKRSLGPNIGIRVSSFANVGPSCQMDVIRGIQRTFTISYAPPAPHPTNTIIAAGGDGISGAFIGGGYSVVDGSFRDQQSNARFSIAQADCETGTKQFNKVTGSVSNMIDGVGIMDGTALAVDTQLTSTGIKYKFIDTRFGGELFCTTWNAVSTFNVGANGNNGFLKTAGGNVDYFANEKYSLYVHPNKFITFNLDKIRKHHSIEISAIKADVGSSLSSCSANQIGHNVLVDGVSKFYKEQAKADLIETLDIPITIDDKYLTIASHGITDGNGDCLQSIFGNLRATSKSCSCVPSPTVWNGTPPAVFTFKGCYNVLKTPGMATVTSGTINSITSTTGADPYHTWVVSVTPHTATKREVDMVGSVCMFGACATFGLLAASASGDPHFIGLNNKGFDVLPKKAAYYNLLSTYNIKVNSKFDFIQMVPNIRSSGTYITEIGIQIPNYNISIVSVDSNDMNVPSSVLTMNGQVYKGAITNAPNQPSLMLLNTARVQAIWNHKNETNEEVQLSWRGRFVDEFTIEIDNTLRIIVLSAEDGYSASNKMWVSYPRRYLAIEVVVLDEGPLAANGMSGIIGRTFKLPMEETNNFNYEDYEVPALWN